MPVRIQRGGEDGSWWSLAEFGALLMCGLNPSQSDCNTSTACSATEGTSESDHWASRPERPGPSDLRKVSLDPGRELVNRWLSAFNLTFGPPESCTWFVSQSADRQESLRVRVEEDSGTVSEKCLTFLKGGLVHVREVEKDSIDALQEVNTLADSDLGDFFLEQLCESVADDESSVAKGVAGSNGFLWCGNSKLVRIDDNCLQDYPVHYWTVLKIAAFVQPRLDPTTDLRVECTKSEDGDIRVAFIVDDGLYETRLVLPPPPMKNTSADQCRQLLKDLSNFWRPEYDKQWNSLWDKIFAQIAPGEGDRRSTPLGPTLNTRRHVTLPANFEYAEELWTSSKALDLANYSTYLKTRHPLTREWAHVGVGWDRETDKAALGWLRQIESEVYYLDRGGEVLPLDRNEFERLKNKPKAMQAKVIDYLQGRTKYFADPSSKWRGIMFGKGRRVDINGYPSNGGSNMLKTLAQLSTKRDFTATSFEVECTAESIYLLLRGEEHWWDIPIDALALRDPTAATLDYWEGLILSMELTHWHDNSAKFAVDASASVSKELCDEDFREMGLRYTGEAEPSNWGTAKCYLKDIPETTDPCRVKVTQCKIPNYYLWESNKDMLEVMVKKADKALAEYVGSITPNSPNESKTSDVRMALYDYREAFVTISSPTEFPEWYLQEMLRAFVCYQRLWPRCTRVHIVPKMVDNKLGGLAWIHSGDQFLKVELPPVVRGVGMFSKEKWRKSIVNKKGLPMADKRKWEFEWGRTDFRRRKRGGIPMGSFLKRILDLPSETS